MGHKPFQALLDSCSLFSFTWLIVLLYIDFSSQAPRCDMMFCCHFKIQKVYLTLKTVPHSEFCFCRRCFLHSINFCWINEQLQAHGAPSIVAGFSELSTQLTKPVHPRRGSSGLSVEQELHSFSHFSVNESIGSSSTPTRYHGNLDLSPVTFHPYCGKNSFLTQDRCTATRVQSEYCNAYVFLQRPLRCGERVVIQVQGVDRTYVGGLAFGLTACNPDTLVGSTLPDDSDLLLDRPEYWVVNKDVCRGPDTGDELSFYLTPDGKFPQSFF